MSFIEPYVRYMLLSDDVITQGQHVSVINLVHAVNVSTFPHTMPRLCVFLSLTGGRGSATAQIVGTNADTGSEVFYSSERLLHFNSDPLHVDGLVYRLFNVKLPQAGLYWVECRMNTRVVAQQTLRVKDRT